MKGNLKKIRERAEKQKRQQSDMKPLEYKKQPIQSVAEYGEDNETKKEECSFWETSNGSDLMGNEKAILNYTPLKGNCLIYRYSSEFGDYIGQTKFSMAKRAGKKGEKYLSNDTAKWSRAIRTYGIDRFTPEILEECPIEEADEREKYYIKKYNSWQAGFNSTSGGKNYLCGTGDIRYEIINLREIYEALSPQAQEDLLFIYTKLLRRETTSLETPDEPIQQLLSLSKELEKTDAWYSYYAFEGEYIDRHENILIWLLNFGFLYKKDFSHYIKEYNDRKECWGREPSMWETLAEIFSYGEILGGDIVSGDGDAYRYKFLFE